MLLRTPSSPTAIKITDLSIDHVSLRRDRRLVHVWMKAGERLVTGVNNTADWRQVNDEIGVACANAFCESIGGPRGGGSAGDQLGAAPDSASSTYPAVPSSTLGGAWLSLAPVPSVTSPTTSS